VYAPKMETDGDKMKVDDTPSVIAVEPSSVSVSTAPKSGRKKGQPSKKRGGSKASISNPPPSVSMDVIQPRKDPASQEKIIPSSPAIVVQVPWTLTWCLDNAMRRPYELQNSFAQRQHVLAAYDMVQPYVAEEKAAVLDLADVAARMNAYARALPSHGPEKFQKVDPYWADPAEWLRALAARYTPARSQLIRSPLDGNCSKCLKLHNNLIMVPMPLQGTIRTIGGRRVLVPEQAPEPSPLGDESSSLCMSCWRAAIKMPSGPASEMFFPKSRKFKITDVGVDAVSEWILDVLDDFMVDDYEDLKDDQGEALDTLELCKDLVVFTYQPVALWYSDPNVWMKDVEQFVDHVKKMDPPAHPAM
jgi:hypothetical protein